uniref:Parathyroid hormone n=1 Tax=Paramormyrops kingsleyae TaxID=1676925 RepID=A0A3B3SI05_9TELE
MKTILIFIFYIICFSKSEGGPVRKRSLGEVQLMHNLGEHKHVQERQDWLQKRLMDIHTALHRSIDRRGTAGAETLQPEHSVVQDRKQKASGNGDFKQM